MKMSTGPAMPERRPVNEALHHLAERLSRLQEYYAASGAEDGGTAGERLTSLQRKLTGNQCVLAICGPFSAGKSTLINRLAGSRILPSSPIPTSANQVLIGHGMPGATVCLANGEELYLQPADFNQLSTLCADGVQVRSVEIRHLLAHVPESVWLMDTPGIDSTDDAHRTVAESALYQADAIFHVMDYNHIQSEANLQFARTLSAWGKPLYLVVNQVDKHLEPELPFAQFRRSVAAAFAAWNVHSDGLFFTSMVDPEHPLNQWHDLLAAIEMLGRRRESLLLSGVWHSATHLMGTLARQQDEASAAELAALQAEAEAGGPDPEARVAALAALLDEAELAPVAALQELTRQASIILENAPLFPHQTKELAEAYLASRKPGFRIGLFGSAAKTRAEVDRRLNALHADLSQRVRAHIHWHLQQLLLQFGEAQTGRDEAYEAAVRALSVPLEPALLAELVKESSLVARAYPYKYMADLTEKIALLYRRALRPLFDRAEELARAAAEAKSGPVRAELQVVRRAIAAAGRLAEISAAKESRRAAVAAILGPKPLAAPDAAEPAVAPALIPAATDAAVVSNATAATAMASAGAACYAPGLQRQPILPPVPSAEAATGLPAADQAEAATGAPAADLGQRLRQETARRLQDAARLLAPLPGVATTSADLEQRAQRLLESHYTVALFGAFSAGKSSFANALMGVNLLPASPNPTTAVITRIAPPTPDRPHGHVHVVWKRPDQLRHEVDRALSALDLPRSGDLAADLAAGAREAPAETSLLAKPHALFLAAAARGYAAARERLGSVESVSLDEFQRLVASEEQSCFVAEITVYVDCPVTRQGITLIDTPGADSINARHTDVAFDYIKNADAVLFVTYYNHAFARADREFLIQLGRVKDSFALDKLFFVINAADLASESAELDLVTAHVRQNLRACGIRDARIFPVSSQTALWSRLQAAGRLPGPLRARLRARLGEPTASLEQGLRAAGMERFEAEFYRFVVTDLSQMAVEAALGEVARTAERIDEWLEAARADESVRAARHAALQAARSQAAAALAALDARPEADEVAREIQELLYYVRRRVLAERFSGAFTEAFNPSSLRSDSPDLKRALRQAFRELTQFVAFDLAQELRATSLRVENAVNRQAERVQARAADAVRRHLPNWASPAFRPEHIPVPAFCDDDHLLSPETAQRLLGLFKSPEHFFAGGGRDRLKDELAKALQEPVDSHLAAARARLSDQYGKLFEQKIAAMAAELSLALEDHVAGLQAALTGTGETEQLEAILERLTALASA